MRGFTSIDIPTQPYIAAYIKALMGPQPKMNGNDAIAKYFNVLLTRHVNYRKSDYRNGWYTVKLRVYIDMHTCNARGHLLNETNVHDFNVFVKNLFKFNFQILMDVHLKTTGNISQALELTREEMGIEDWNEESMLKSYYRYRAKKGMPLQYEKRKLTTNLSD